MVCLCAHARARGRPNLFMAVAALVGAIFHGFRSRSLSRYKLTFWHFPGETGGGHETAEFRVLSAWSHEALLYEEFTCI